MDLDKPTSVLRTNVGMRLFVSGIFLVATCIRCFAVDVPLTTAKQQRERPEMPNVFDQETVQQLIADIDKPYSESSLKVGYFMRRGASSLSLMQGYDLLKKATDKEQKGSRRWFQLKGLQGFAAFRVSGINASEGFDTYSMIFSHPREAVASNANYHLRQAIAEYTALVAGKLGDLGLRKNAMTQEVLLKAWTAYVVSLASPLPKGSVPIEPQWAPAIQRAGATEKFAPYVERMLNDPSVHKNFSLLFTAAGVVASKEPERALLLFQKAQQLLPKSKTDLDINDVGRFYDAWVELLVSQDQLPNAITIHHERIKLLGGGQSKLLSLYKESGNANEIDRILAELKGPTADGRQINEVATTLFSSALQSEPTDTSAAKQGIELLDAFLAIGRVREVNDELEARISLVNFYMKQNDVDKAKTALKFDLPKEPFTSKTRILLRTINRLKERCG